jgi:hypothetical protein
VYSSIPDEQQARDYDNVINKSQSVVPSSLSSAPTAWNEARSQKVSILSQLVEEEECKQQHHHHQSDISFTDLQRGARTQNDSAPSQFEEEEEGYPSDISFTDVLDSGYHASSPSSSSSVSLKDKKATRLR